MKPVFRRFKPRLNFIKFGLCLLQMNLQLTNKNNGMPDAQPLKPLSDPLHYEKILKRDEVGQFPPSFFSAWIRNSPKIESHLKSCLQPLQHFSSVCINAYIKTHNLISIWGWVYLLTKYVSHLLAPTPLINTLRPIFNRCTSYCASI